MNTDNRRKQDLDYLIRKALASPETNSIADRVTSTQTDAAAALSDLRDGTNGLTAIKNAVNTASSYASDSKTAAETLRDSRLTAARAAALDNISGGDIYNNVRYLADANWDTESLGTKIARLTATRAGLLDDLDFLVNAAMDGNVTTAENSMGWILQALRDRLTATRAGYLDNLNHYGATQKDAINDTWSRVDAKIPSGGIGPGIRSIQRGVITFSNSDWSKTHTLSTTLVDTSKASVHFLGQGDGSAGGRAYISGLSTTTITATRTNTNTGSHYVGYEVIEYY